MPPNESYQSCSFADYIRVAAVTFSLIDIKKKLLMHSAHISQNDKFGQFDSCVSHWHPLTFPYIHLFNVFNNDAQNYLASRH